MATIDEARRRMSAIRAAAKARRDAGKPGWKTEDDKIEMQAELERQGLDPEAARSVAQSRASRILHGLPPEAPG